MDRIIGIKVFLFFPEKIFGFILNILDIPVNQLIGFSLCFLSLWSSSGVHHG